MVLSFKKELLLFLLLAYPSFATEVKLATWNLNWLTARTAAEADLPSDVQPRAPEDFVLLHGYAVHLNADVVAFEEVDGAGVASRLFDPLDYQILTIAEDVVQRVGLAVRRGIRVERHPDVAALDVEAEAPHRLRDGLDATLHFPDGPFLRLLAVHLKTGCHTDRIETSSRPQCALLARQIPVLADWVAARQAEGVPFALVGDFNRVLDRPEALGGALMRAAPLLRATAGASDPCWDGGAFNDHS